MAAAMSISMQPPPQTTRVSLIVSVSTHKASCRERSASSVDSGGDGRRMGYNRENDDILRSTHAYYVKDMHEEEV